MLKVIPNFLRNSEQIVEQVKRLDHLFVQRSGMDSHGGFIPNIQSRFKTLKSEHMPPELIKLIFSDCDFDDETRDFWDFIQIQKYEPGDYIVPHRDSYSVTKLHLITLTESEKDGLVCEDDDHILHFIPDRAGQYIDFPYIAAHYVSPVRELRYSLVVGM